MNEDIRIRPLRREDIAPLLSLARDTWYAHYPSIISTAQIEYMLGQRYRPELIEEDLAHADRWWDVMERNGELLAFAQYERAGEPGEIKLDKLYVKHDERGQGHGSLMLTHVENEARSKGAGRLYLQVNKNNASAIAAYRKNGFGIDRELVVDIGGGFVMDDYVMAKALAPLPA